MIEIKNLNFQYSSERQILKNINLSINDGEKVALIGANGAGKSTLMKTILGLLNGQGEILVDGLLVNPTNIAEVRKKVGFVLQDSDDQMFMPTVKEDMIFGPVNYGMKKEDAEKKVDEVLKLLDIEYLKDSYNHKISSGQKRMAAIATILMMEPSVIIMDEPSASLDPKNRRKVINVLKGLTQTLVIATHDLDMALDLCDKVILINDGQVVKQGTIQEILYDKKLLEENNLELPFSLVNMAL